MAASKFTAQTRGALIERFAAGLSVPDAARACEVNETTLKRWLGRGRKEKGGEYADFTRAVEGAREKARQRPEAMTPEEFRRHLDKAVRAGSVQAMKLWADLHSSNDDAEADPLAEFEALAE